AGGGLSTPDLEPGASPRRSRKGCYGRARSRRRLWRPAFRPAGRRAALTAEAPRRLDRCERRLGSWGKSGRAALRRKPPSPNWKRHGGDLASLPDSFHAPSPHSSAEPRKSLSPFRGIRADTCYVVYKAQGRFDRAQKRGLLLGLFLWS